MVVDVGPYRQYTIRLDGSGRVTVRNRRFLRPISDTVLDPHTALDAGGGGREMTCKNITAVRCDIEVRQRYDITRGLQATRGQDGQSGWRAHGDIWCI